MLSNVICCLYTSPSARWSCPSILVWSKQERKSGKNHLPLRNDLPHKKIPIWILINSCIFYSLYSHIIIYVLSIDYVIMCVFKSLLAQLINRWRFNFSKSSGCHAWHCRLFLYISLQLKDRVEMWVWLYILVLFHLSMSVSRSARSNLTSVLAWNTL